MKERRGSMLDLLILLLIVLGGFGTLGRFFEARATASDNGSVATVTVELFAYEAHLPSVLAEGEAVFLSSGEHFGELSSVRAEPSRVTVEANGEHLTGAWEDGTLWDTVLELRVTGSVSEERVFLREGGEALLVGQQLSLYTERAYLYGTVKSVEISLQD